MVLELNIHVGKIKAHPTTMHTINSRKITELNRVPKSKQKKRPYSLGVSRYFLRYRNSYQEKSKQKTWWKALYNLKYSDY